MPKIKPLIVEIIYRPPNQSKFLAIINANFDKLDTDTKESYILGDFNINMYQNNKLKYIVRDDNTISLKFLSSDMKNYHQFCIMHGLKQLIKSPTRVTCSTSILIDNLTIDMFLCKSFSERCHRRTDIWSSTYFVRAKNLTSKSRWYLQVFELLFI